jgi:hypothetical protein
MYTKRIDQHHLPASCYYARDIHKIGARLAALLKKYDTGKELRRYFVDRVLCKSPWGINGLTKFVLEETIHLSLAYRTLQKSPLSISKEPLFINKSDFAGLGQKFHVGKLFDDLTEKGYLGCYHEKWFVKKSFFKLNDPSELKLSAQFREQQASIYQILWYSNPVHVRLDLLRHIKRIVDELERAKDYDTTRALMALPVKILEAHDRGDQQGFLRALYDFKQLFEKPALTRKVLEELQLPKNGKNTTITMSSYDNHSCTLLVEGNSPTSIMYDKFLARYSQVTIIFPEKPTVTQQLEFIRAGEILGIKVESAIALDHSPLSITTPKLQKTSWWKKIFRSYNDLTPPLQYMSRLGISLGLTVSLILLFPVLALPAWWLLPVWMIGNFLRNIGLYTHLQRGTRSKQGQPNRINLHKTTQSLSYSILSIPLLQASSLWLTPLLQGLPGIAALVLSLFCLAGIKAIYVFIHNRLRGLDKLTTSLNVCRPFIGSFSAMLVSSGLFFFSGIQIPPSAYAVLNQVLGEITAFFSEGAVLKRNYIQTHCRYLESQHMTEDQDSVLRFNIEALGIMDEPAGAQAIKKFISRLAPRDIQRLRAHLQANETEYTNYLFEDYSVRKPQRLADYFNARKDDYQKLLRRILRDQLRNIRRKRLSPL